MGSTSPDEMLRKSDMGEPAINLACSGETPRMNTDLDDMIRTPMKYNENQRNTAGQEEDGLDCDLGSKDGEDSKLPKVMKVSNSLKDLADAGKDKSDAAATTKQGYVDDYVKGGDKDGVMDREKLSRRDAFSRGVAGHF